MNEQQNKIWNYLLDNAKGKSNAIKMKKIAEANGIPHRGTNNDDVREWIKDMVINYGKQIGTCSKGAFIILTQQDLEDSIKHIDKIDEIQKRITAINKNGLYES